MKGVWFSNKHSNANYHMILSGVTIGYPTVKTKYVDIPRGDGSHDLTEAFGGVKYNDRTLNFKFTFIGDWDREKGKVINEIHGRRIKIVLDEDPDYYYIGRCSVDSRQKEKNIHSISVTAVCEPFKYKKQITTHTDKIENQKDIILVNDSRPVIPYIECDSDMKLTVDGKAYSLKKGKQKILDVKLVSGHNRMSITGTGTVTFTYQEGAL